MARASSVKVPAGSESSAKRPPASVVSASPLPWTSTCALATGGPARVRTRPPTRAVPRCRATVSPATARRATSRSRWRRPSGGACSSTAAVRGRPSAGRHAGETRAAREGRQSERWHSARGTAERSRRVPSGDPATVGAGSDRRAREVARIDPPLALARRSIGHPSGRSRQSTPPHFMPAPSVARRAAVHASRRRRGRPSSPAAATRGADARRRAGRGHGRR